MSEHCTQISLLHVCDNSVLQKHGLKVLLRDPYSFTPILENSQSGKVPRSLLLGSSMAETQSQISQFSLKDAQVFGEGWSWRQRGKECRTCHSHMMQNKTFVSAWACSRNESKLRSFSSFTFAGFSQVWGLHEPLGDSHWSSTWYLSNGCSCTHPGLLASAIQGLGRVESPVLCRWETGGPGPAICDMYPDFSSVVVVLDYVDD